MNEWKHNTHYPPIHPPQPNPTAPPQIHPQIGFDCVKEVLTVTTFLESRDALALLLDARVLIATRDITDKGGRRSREEVRACVRVSRCCCRRCRWPEVDVIWRLVGWSRGIHAQTVTHPNAPTYHDQVAGDVARKQRAARELKAQFADPASGFNLTADDVQRVSHVESSHVVVLGVGGVVYVYVCPRAARVIDLADRRNGRMDATYPQHKSGAGLHRGLQQLPQLQRGPRPPHDPPPACAYRASDCISVHDNVRLF